jgi:hypothetical protein
VHGCSRTAKDVFVWLEGANAEGRLALPYNLIVKPVLLGLRISSLPRGSRSIVEKGMFLSQRQMTVPSNVCCDCAEGVSRIAAAYL